MQGAGWRWNWVNVTCNIVICNIFHSGKKSLYLFGYSKLFYYLCKAQLSHIPPPAHPLSRETASPCTPATRHYTPLMAHALPHALSARDCLTRCTSQGLCHTRHTHATHPRPHSTLALRATTPRKGYAMPRYHQAWKPRSSTHPRPPCYPPRKGYATCAAHTLRILALTAPTPPQRAMPRTLLLMRLKRPSHYTPSTFWEESASPITTKILHITILHVTFTRIGVKTTQKSEAIFSFID